MRYRYLHIFEYEDGSVVELRSNSLEPSRELRMGMLGNGYDYIHTKIVAEPRHY